MAARKREESQALAAIQDALIAAGAVTWRCNTGVAVYGAAKVRYGLGIGAADLVGVYRGRFFGVEVKSSRGRQSPAQKAWQRAVEGAGGIYVLARDVDTAMDGVVGTIERRTGARSLLA
jgi:hypothetical protein